MHRLALSLVRSSSFFPTLPFVPFAFLSSVTQLYLTLLTHGFPFLFHLVHGGFSRGHKKRRSEGLRNPAEIKPKLTGPTLV